MARLVMKHPRDFRVGDIVCDEGFVDVEIVEVVGWSKHHRGYEFRCRDLHDGAIIAGSTFYCGDFTYKVKRG